MEPKQFIVEVTGKVILRSEYTQNSENLFSTVGTVMSDVVLHRSLNLAVDCREQPCIASHIRRHCKPNAELRSFFVAGVDTDVVHLGVFSTAPIAAGEEILLPWTLSAELLPDGLGNAVEEDLSKRLIAKAFHNAYNAIGRTLTQDQAKQVIQCLRQDCCPCLREPLCIMNRFFRIRKLFWSRMKLPTLAGIENPTTTTTTVASQSTAHEEKKAASGSETELDSSADVHLTCHPANELTPLEENSSPQQASLEPVLDTPQALEAVQSESRPTPPPLVKSCQPSSPAGISKSPASPTLPPLPAITPSCVVSRREQLQSMSLAKYFIAKYNSEHGLTPKEEKEVALRPTPPRSSATESEPVPHTSPPQATSSSTPQAAHENNQPAVASLPATQLTAASVSPDLMVAPQPPGVDNSPAPKKPSPVESPALRPKSPRERHPARLTPRKGQRLSWKQFVIDPKSESQPPLSSSRPLNGHSSNGHSRRALTRTAKRPVEWTSDFFCNLSACKRSSSHCISVSISKSSPLPAEGSIARCSSAYSQE
ncbi:SET domain-containing protein 3 [Entomophthora muscae]|uniref:SET domain-containing protein 3 n=1 Tax=Entomophthora muscae TaxID=34485 RepID=A0ACC2SZ54_9FUNG|nr:SET domain-containing protein 3 [Entomophthora muscae]